MALTVSPNFSNFLQNLSGLASGNTVGDQFANVNALMANQQQAAATQQQLNKTREYLKRIDPQNADAYDGLTGEALNAAISSTLKARQEAAAPKYQIQNINGRLVRVDVNQGKVDELGNFPSEKKLINAGNGLLYDPAENRWIQPPADMAAGQTEWGLNPVWVRDPKTNKQRLMVISKTGETKFLDTQGTDPLSVLKPVDTGTGTMLLDPRTAYPVKTVPKDLAGAEAEKTKGKLTGEALQQLPATIQKADQAVDIIDKALAHPGRETATGLSSVLDPRNYVPGTDARDFLEYNKQIAGKAFLEAFESLKGGGQITEIEGQKATQAIARLSTAQSDEAYKQALLELREVIESGKRRAQQMAGQAVQPLQPVNSGVTKSGVKFSVEP